jgi:hypothetical protein
MKKTWCVALFGVLVVLAVAANSGLAQNSASLPFDSSSAADISKVYLPAIARTYPLPETLLYEEFTTGMPAAWTPFLNWPELKANDWYWKGDGTTWGRIEYNDAKEVEQWALLMYLGEGAQQWTDYRIEASIRNEDGQEYRHLLMCIWFRGTYQQRTDMQGGDVTGYAFCLRPDNDTVYYESIDPATHKLYFLWRSEVGLRVKSNTWYKVTIEVQGNHMVASVDDQVVLGWYDPNQTWMQGTVGFASFRRGMQIDYIHVSPLEN